MTYSLLITDPDTGEVTELCVPDCGDQHTENDDEGKCDPIDPEDGPPIVTPPPEPVPEPPITCEQELEFDLTSVSNLCDEGNQLDFDITLDTDAIFAPEPLQDVIDATNAYVAATYDGTHTFPMDFTEIFEWNGVASHHL